MKTLTLTNSNDLNASDLYKYPVPEINTMDINLGQLRRNYQEIIKHIAPTVKFMAVLKGDAYGHGIVPVAKELVNCHCDAFGVVRFNEAFALREAGVRLPILMLAPIMPSQVPWVINHNITPMVDEEMIIKELNKEGLARNQIISIHVKMNTGLNRFGLNEEQVIPFFKKVKEEYSYIKIEGFYTHFQNADYDKEFTKLQISRFERAVQQLEKENLRPELIHAANSAVLMKYPEAHYDMVRCGIILFGLEHTEGEKVIPAGVKELVSLKGRIIKIRDIAMGERAGYGSGFIAPRNTKIAFIAMGYGDGISRGWKEVIVQGQRAPIINYFMDGILVDITNLKGNVQLYEEATIIGSQETQTIGWGEACKALNSYEDEQIQFLTERVPKRYYYD